MYAHWPGLTLTARRRLPGPPAGRAALAGRFGDETVWMKLSEIARYWAPGS
jgi:hypothetical protein